MQVDFGVSVLVQLPRASEFVVEARLLSGPGSRSRAISLTSFRQPQQAIPSKLQSLSLVQPLDLWLRNGRARSWHCNFDCRCHMYCRYLLLLLLRYSIHLHIHVIQSPHSPLYPSLAAQPTFGCGYKPSRGLYTTAGLTAPCTPNTLSATNHSRQTRLSRAAHCLFAL